jgi:hypothetical protein
MILLLAQHTYQLVKLELGHNHFVQFHSGKLLSMVGTRVQQYSVARKWDQSVKTCASQFQDLFTVLKDKIRHNHADSCWLCVSSALLRDCSSCLLIAHVLPLCNSCLKKEVDFIDISFHLRVLRYRGTKI